MSSSARVGVGEGLVACRSINFRRPGALLGSSEAFGSGYGQALPGVPRKAPLCLLDRYVPWLSPLGVAPNQARPTRQACAKARAGIYHLTNYHPTRTHNTTMNPTPPTRLWHGWLQATFESGVTHWRHWRRYRSQKSSPVLSSCSGGMPQMNSPARASHIMTWKFLNSTVALITAMSVLPGNRHVTKPGKTPLIQKN